MYRFYELTFFNQFFKFLYLKKKLMYLSTINIQNYKGVEHLTVNFNPEINIVIGENGSCKTALIDAIRLMYNLGNYKKDIYVSYEDFFFNSKTKVQSRKIEIQYIFRGLSSSEKGALYEYLILDPTNSDLDHAQITLIYELRDDMYPKFSYYTGVAIEQKADSGTFDIFQHYYLGALRDSTNDLLNVKSNMLGSVIKRLVERSKAEENFKKIIKTANDELLKQKEVLETRTSVNSHLEDIFKISKDNQIGLRIEESSKIEGIVNVIKPYLPHDRKLLEDGWVGNEPVSIGDHLIANTDNGSNVPKNYQIIEKGIPDIVDATESVKGLIQIATEAEAIVGTDTLKAMTPRSTKVVLDAKIKSKTVLIGDGSSVTFPINHNWNTWNVDYICYRTTDNRKINVSCVTTSANDVRIDVLAPLTQDEYRITLTARLD
jgi:hypothetical protein